jgi:pyruvate/2-oxoglutarate dehydrogenase complex dihydrolipoamide acyltransferase (E2) component
VVCKGDPVAEIETDKAVFTIEAEEEEYVLGFVQALARGE